MSYDPHRYVVVVASRAGEEHSQLAASTAEAREAIQRLSATYRWPTYCVAVSRGDGEDMDLEEMDECEP